MKRYFFSALCILIVAWVSQFGSTIFQSFEHSPEKELLTNFFVISVLFVLSFLIFYLSHLIKLPSFVMAIFLGIAARSFLMPIAEHKEILGIIVGLGATLILFSGGLEIPFNSFKKLIWKIFSISFIGLLITAFLFSWGIWFLAPLFGLKLSLLTAVLLGAVLASTDPAAIIPVLKKLRFHNRSIKDIIISESAVTDVVGTLLTVVFLTLALSGHSFSSINSWYGSIFNLQSISILEKQLFFGTLLGCAGYFFLEILLKFKKFYGQEFEADSAFFISIPIIIFTFALFMEGSGYLAAFIAGLIFHITEHLKETERFFNNLVDGFLKPIIFILLGVLVDLPKLIEYAPIGIAMALIFMFIIRPIAVFISLGAFKFWGKEKLTLRDLFFISFIRETGAIPAVLLLTIVSLGLAEINGLVEIGMWSILLTLIIEPLLTPFVAKFLKVAEEMQDKKNPSLGNSSSIILVTRGESFIERFSFVRDWAIKHSVSKIIIMLCLEDNYSIENETSIQQKALELFKKETDYLRKNSLFEIEFDFISRKGSLHENIDQISKTDHKIIAIFVGKKMLDFRLDQIKQLSTPFYFMN